MRAFGQAAKVAALFYFFLSLFVSLTLFLSLSLALSLFLTLSFSLYPFLSLSHSLSCPLSHGLSFLEQDLNTGLLRGTPRLYH